jgi:uncharacterized phage-associated protein
MKILDKALDKRINAILYFCKNVKYPGKTKIYKLLYFLDFIHFKQVGRPVTDLEYYAFDFGPVPLKLHEEIEENRIPEDMSRCIGVSEKKDPDTGEVIITQFFPKTKPDLEVFSEREIKILQNVAMMYKDAKAEDMSEVSHLKNEPWDQTVKRIGKFKRIDFMLALDKDALIASSAAKERMRQIKEMKDLFG